MNSGAEVNCYERAVTATYRQTCTRAHGHTIFIPKAFLVEGFAMSWNTDSLTDFSLPLEERMKTLLLSLLHDPNNTGFDTIGLGVFELLSVSQDTQSVRHAFTVLPKLCNRGGSLHGGAASTIFDILTTTALLTVAKPGYWDMLGVSRTLTITFLRPLPLGTKVFVNCEVVAVGKNMANIKGTMKTADGKVCVTCIHDKATQQRPKL